MKWLRWGVRALGEVLITVSLFLFLFLAWQLWWTDVTATRAQAVTIHTLEKGFGPAGTPQPRVADPQAILTKVPFGQAFAIMRIPRFGTDYAIPVLQGAVLLVGIVYMASTLIADLLIAYLNPRVRLEIKR